jgi:hypothetical protein
MGPERRRSQRSHSGNSVRAGRKQGTPREYGLVEALSSVLAACSSRILSDMKETTF